MIARVSDDRRQSIVVVMTDHQRFDSLFMNQPGRDGTAVEVTPNLNRLARRAWRNTRCYDACPLCVPARTALATGLPPKDNGVVCNEFDRGFSTPAVTIHERLAAAGYDVGHVGVHHVRTDPPLTERVDFALWVDDAAYRDRLRDAGIDVTVGPEFKRTVVDPEISGDRERPYSNASVGTWPGPAELFKDLVWADFAADWLRGRRSDETPFALFVNLWAPHPPLVLPEPYRSMFPPETLELPPDVGVPATDEPPSRRLNAARQLAEDVTEAEWREAWSAHLGLTRLADDAAGRVFDAAPDYALIVFTSDHGDHMGQHAMYQKMEPYEAACRVPLLIAGPGIAPATSDRLAWHLDLAPTFLDAAGLDTPPELPGQSLLPIARGEAELPSDRPVFIELDGNFTRAQPAARRRAVVTQRFKATFTPGDSAELFDLQQDPHETANLAADPRHAATLADLGSRALAWFGTLDE